MIKILFFYLNFILFFNLFTTSYLLANDGATGIIKERMDKFQKSKSLMKEINKGLQNNNFSLSLLSILLTTDALTITFELYSLEHSILNISFI